MAHHYPVQDKECCQTETIYVFETILSPVGCLSLPQGYVHVYDHNIQTFSLKPFGRGTSLGRGMKICINGQGHMTKMAAIMADKLDSPMFEQYGHAQTMHHHLRTWARSQVAFPQKKSRRSS